MSVCQRICLALMVATALGAAAIAQADQRAAELPALFDALQGAASQSEVNAIEAQIWQHWLLAPDDSSRSQISQLGLAMQAGELEIALQFANQLVDSSPEFAEAWNKRATIHYLMGNNDASVADIRETLLLEPRHFGAISGLGLIFMRQGNLQAALDAFEQVLAISPASENALRSAERVRDELGSKI